VGLYLAPPPPPERAVVLCGDEKPQMLALSRMQPIFPLLPGIPERRSHDYARHGTTSLFAALHYDTGEEVGSLRRRHRTQEFKQFLEPLDATAPPDPAVHLVLDNYATHKSPPIQRGVLRHPRFTLHFIPTGSSWLNLVARWFAALTPKKLHRSAHRFVPDLEADIRAGLATSTAHPRPYVWVKMADQIMASLKRYCERINGSGY